MGYLVAMETYVTLFWLMHFFARYILLGPINVPKISQYFTFNMGKSYTIVDVQVTDEGGRD